MTAGTITLYCELGAHHWERETKRGRAPINCPEHQPVKVERTPRASARVTTIEAYLAKRGSCTCKIDPTMTDEELQHVESCTPHWVCPTLDKVRASVTNYRRHFQSEEDDDE